MNSRILVAVIPLVAFTAGCHSRDIAAGQPVAVAQVPIAQGSSEQHPGTKVHAVPAVGTAGEAESGWRWGRTEDRSDGRYLPTSADWFDEPNSWELRPIADVPSIPEVLRRALMQLDCVIPRFRFGSGESAVIWGEFERAGQRDVAILCVHSDRSSSTYVFWNGDPARMEPMPSSGNEISAVARTHVEAAADSALALQPDMPTVVNHDAIDIGCCECCSTIFYRHNGKWFTLPGAD